MKIKILTSIVASVLLIQVAADASTILDQPIYIRNGVDVVEGDRRYQAFLSIKSESGESVVCGGSVIDNQWILTAAHCIKPGSVVDEVRAGSPYLYGSKIQIMETDGSFNHPLYTSTSDSKGYLIDKKHDIALVRLKEPTSLPKLPLANTAMLSNHGAVGSLATASGWGLVDREPDEWTETMQETDLQVLDHSCSYNNTFICAGTPPGETLTSVCSGDSGGPLTVTVNGKDYGIGVASHAAKNCDGLSYYTNVTDYLAWIDQTKEAKIANARVIKSGWSVGTEQTCKAPFNHVVTGFGGRMDNRNRVTTLRLQVRPILSDGALGARSIVRCGIFPDVGNERFVELPEGYVMTGFAAHSQKNNFVGVTAYGKLYDPNSMSLVGDTITKYHGTNGAEVSYTPTSATDKNNTIITGIGFRAYKSNFRGYHAYLGDIK